MEIYIAKPGGQKEGPFALDQINGDLAAGKLRDSEYWAWHEGMPQWEPLYALQGVSAKPVNVTSSTGSSAEEPASASKSQPTAANAPKPAPAPKSNPVLSLEPKIETEAEKKPSLAVENAAAPVVKAQESPFGSSEVLFHKALKPTDKPAPVQFVQVKSTPVEEAEVVPVFQKTIVAHKEEPASAEAESNVFKAAVPVPSATIEVDQTKPETPRMLQVFSVLPFEALEHIFIFTTGDGRLIFDFPSVPNKLQDAIGAELHVIRETVKVDVVGNADIGVDIMTEDAVPEKAWRVMSGIRPHIAKAVTDGLYHITVRSFAVDAEDSVALFLLYDKEKL